MKATQVSFFFFCCLSCSVPGCLWDSSQADVLIDQEGLGEPCSGVVAVSFHPRSVDLKWGETAPVSCYLLEASEPGAPHPKLQFWPKQLDGEILRDRSAKTLQLRESELALKRYCEEKLRFVFETGLCPPKYSCFHTGDYAKSPICVPSLCKEPLKACDLVNCIDTNNSLEHCGDCGQPCAKGLICQDGQCQCPSYLKNCGDETQLICIDTQNDSQHCGGCQEPCEANALCKNGQCECVEGFKRCTDAAGKPQCFNFQQDPKHCGGCDQACNEANPFCIEGSCSQEGCPKGQTACNSICTNLNTNPLHCGQCGENCHKTVQNAAASCEDSKCSYRACYLGYADCNGQKADGCEVQIVSPNTFVCTPKRNCHQNFKPTVPSIESHCHMHCSNFDSLKAEDDFYVLNYTYNRSDEELKHALNLYQKNHLPKGNSKNPVDLLQKHYLYMPSSSSDSIYLVSKDLDKELCYFYKISYEDFNNFNVEKFNNNSFRCKSNFSNSDRDWRNGCEVEFKKSDKLQCNDKNLHLSPEEKKLPACELFEWDPLLPGTIYNNPSSPQNPSIYSYYCDGCEPGGICINYNDAKHPSLFNCAPRPIPQNDPTKKTLEYQNFVVEAILEQPWTQYKIHRKDLK